jgi:protein-S-isoprenylcysteine O-methyltransferase Ste14
MTQETWNCTLGAWIAFAPLIALILTRITAPYGRHSSGKAGPGVPPRLGWFLMELPALLTFPAWALTAPTPQSPVLWPLLAMWVLHYGNRTLVYPLRLRSGTPLPVVILLSGVFFNLINGTVLVVGLTRYGGLPDAAWLSHPAMWIGVALFLGGFLLNLHADAVLRRMRRANPAGYSVPRAGAYRWVSSPNYLGEMVEWCGFALATFSLAGVAFAVWTAANLFPRALTHHRWYRAKFPDYPPDRKAVIPYIL